MEEWVGERWHRFVTRRAEGAASAHRVLLDDVQRNLSWLLHAAGAAQRVAVATPIDVGGARRLWQRVAGSGQRAALAQLDGEVLALPPVVDLYGDAGLNRDLYLWWAALAAHLPLDQPWVAANRQAGVAALRTFPGLDGVARRLMQAELARRTNICSATAPQDAGERAVCAWLDNPQAALDDTRLRPADVHPVWCWIVPVPTIDGTAEARAAAEAARRGPGAPAQSLAQRRRVQRSTAGKPRAPLLLAPKSEWLKTFADPMNLERAHDDEDDGSADVAAEELQTLTLQRSDGSLAARVRFDLDLPSASADDAPVGDGEPLPEWDVRRRQLVPGRVLAQAYEARRTEPWQPAPALRAHAARVRRRMDLQRAAPRWQRGMGDGEAIDLDAWVRSRGERPQAVSRAIDGTGRPIAPEDAVYLRRVKGQRELATLLLADLSLSTDAYANDHQRIIDVIRDALFVFGEALAAHGDTFAMLGFSSIKRQLRLHEIKRFDEHWGPRPLQRVGSIRPGWYTRMGAALRAGTRRLEKRPERQRLLLLLTDGKPHDLDGYEGRLGLEDTRQAVLEARRAGLLPFAISIDSDAGEVLPALFGRQGFAWVRRPEELPHRLAALHSQLMR